MTHAYSRWIIAYVVTRPDEIRHAALTGQSERLRGHAHPHANSCGVGYGLAIQGLIPYLSRLIGFDPWAG